MAVDREFLTTTMAGFRKQQEVLSAKIAAYQGAYQALELCLARLDDDEDEYKYDPEDVARAQEFLESDEYKLSEAEAQFEHEFGEPIGDEYEQE